jgi:phosphoglycolate phosphatase
MRRKLLCYSFVKALLHGLRAKRKGQLWQEPKMTHSGFAFAQPLAYRRASTFRFGGKTLRPIVIFDLDGTLVNTAPDLLASLNHVLMAEKIEPVIFEEMTYLVGQGARDMIVRAHALRNIDLDPARLPALLDSLVEHYLAEMPGLSQPYPGVVEALERLMAGGFALAVCTNKLERLAAPLVDKLGLSGYFEVITGGDTFAVRKPDAGHILSTIDKAGADPARAVMIGDSVNDIKAASNAGIPSIAVPFGYSDVPVESLSPTHIIAHFDELTPELVSRLIQN